MVFLCFRVDGGQSERGYGFNIPRRTFASFHSAFMCTVTEVHFLELKIPPAALVLLAALLMWLGSSLVPGFTFHFQFQRIVAWSFILVGVIVSARGFIQFKRAKTTVNPTKPESSSSLVTSGIYQRTRNPMYLGFFLTLLGWAIWTANVLSFAVLPLFVLYMNRFQIKPEERALARIFGDEFKTYCSQVRRWI
jgi:protein-S-isoprenylcysteine O-methyltransferase Ste14